MRRKKNCLRRDSKCTRAQTRTPSLAVRRHAEEDKTTEASHPSSEKRSEADTQKHVHVRRHSLCTCTYRCIDTPQLLVRHAAPPRWRVRAPLLRNTNPRASVNASTYTDIRVRLNKSSMYLDISLHLRRQGLQNRGGEGMSPKVYTGVLRKSIRLAGVSAAV